MGEGKGRERERDRDRGKQSGSETGRGRKRNTRRGGGRGDKNGFPTPYLSYLRLMVSGRKATVHDPSTGISVSVAPSLASH